MPRPPVKNRLRHLRESRGMARHEVGAVVNRDSSIIARYERGDGGIPDDVKLQLAALFEVSVEYLMGWDSGAEPSGVAA